VTYSQPPVEQLLTAFTIPVQIDNSSESNAATVKRYQHIWTPDLRVLDPEQNELYRWDGYLPPPEFMARAIVAFGQARLRMREFDEAQAHFVDVLRRFPSTYAASEAQYYLGVARYRADPNGNDLLHQWSILRSKYPASEYRLKQSFKELP
jgi:hypothetical protein